jgi:hypothetical protein
MSWSKADLICPFYFSFHFILVGPSVKKVYGGDKKI